MVQRFILFLLLYRIAFSRGVLEVGQIRYNMFPSGYPQRNFTGWVCGCFGECFEQVWYPASAIYHLIENTKLFSNKEKMFS